MHLCTALWSVSVFMLMLVFVNMHTVSSFLAPPPQQEHEEDGTEQNRECAHSGNNDLSYHLHVAGQRVCKAHIHTHTLTTHRHCGVHTLLIMRVMMLKHSTQRVNIFPLIKILYLIYSEHEGFLTMYKS